MKKSGLFLGLALLGVGSLTAAAQDAKLTGFVLGTSGTNGTERGYAFDGNLNTNFYAQKDGVFRPWAGLDLSQPHVITAIRFMPDRSSVSCSRLAVFQGANSSDFIDAMPIAMVPVEGPKAGEWFEIPVNVSKGFRYVRMVCPGRDNMNVIEIEFYGHAGEGDDSQFYQVTNLPTVAFNTPGMKEIVSKDDKHPGSTVYVISDGGKTLLTDANAQMKGRGNGSWEMEKKPFQIKFDKKQKILNNAKSKSKKWTLINNHGDKSLMRNKVAFAMSDGLGLPYSSYCQFVDVIYNGQYNGTYQLCDQMEVREGRVDITEMTPEDVSGDALTGGYFIEVDAYADREKSWFRANGHNGQPGITVTIKSPDEDEIVPAQSQYIKDHFNKMVDAVYASNYSDPVSGLRKYLDMDSFLRYFLHGELTGNTDTYWSTYMTKERNSDKFTVGPVWDQDLAFDNDYRTYPLNQKSDYIYKFDGASAADGMKDFVTRVLGSGLQTSKERNKIWQDARNSGRFSADYFNSLIDEWAEELAQSQKLNFTRWPILSSQVHMEPRVPGSYDAEIRFIKKYVTERFDRLDTKFSYDPTSGVGEIADEPDAAEEWYRIDGTRVDGTNLTPGIYVRRQGAKSEKILVR